MKPATISLAECREIRSRLNGSAAELAHRAGLEASDVHAFESGRTIPSDQTLRGIERAFAEAGREG